ncbi:MAG TPA: phosphoribosyltransferase family protein [Verrucomicrobiae bacterium]|nr:phosphoribosyltransferase family protein [Verrucomicrobiae bacterium]
MRFASRQDAGRELGEFLSQRGVTADLILGLPRGGVVVAAEVARRLKLPLDVLAVRKIGHPLQREFAVGALAEPDYVFLHERSLEEYPVEPAGLEEVIAEEKLRLHEYARRFHLRGMPPLRGKNVLLIDDGLATGATTEAAVRSARQQKSRHIAVAAPVASVEAVARLGQIADAVEVIFIDSEFQAVGQYYLDFTQTTDAEVMELLRAAQGEK